jgi:hypothetical protein
MIGHALEQATLAIPEAQRVWFTRQGLAGPIAADLATIVRDSGWFRTASVITLDSPISL